MTPTERLAIRIEELQAELQLANERLFYLVAELAKANAQLGHVNYSTFPLNKTK